MHSNVAETYRDGTVFITGASGFLGKVLTEKLIRSCPVKNVVVLIRSKKGRDVSQRMDEIYKNVLFDRLRREKPDFMNCIKGIEGNIDEITMGLSSADREWMIENVNFIFHCAATIKFNEPIAVATKINVIGTENVLTLASHMKNLKGFVHVSTVFSHYINHEIKEQHYPVPITAEKLKEFVKNIDEKSTSKLPTVLGNWPNTYTFTKAVTEDMIAKNVHHLPISIFRPSIVENTKSEPEPGWMDQVPSGLSGMTTQCILGLLRVLALDSKKSNDIVPVDYTANALISVMWETVKNYRDCNEISTKEPKIYNYVSYTDPPLTWGKFCNYVCEAYYESPPFSSYWYIFYITSSTPWVIKVSRFILHRLPAAITDFVSVILSGQSPNMWNICAKSDYHIDLLYPFSTREWKFGKDNILNLWLSLSEEDRETFWFSFEDFDWKAYIRDIVLGIKKHVLHEDECDLKKSISKNRRLFWLHCLCLGALIYLLSKLLLSVFDL